ncbi:DUF2336 domain-containing protein [Pelagibius marinus]|uniref:DUF2336 domain-containing protein n=1 Tax=Pelagibius marinus TaxID=2762760 RepID=UPI001872FFDE|nr:DUF2336 domain-containing protein [Pelagibius marinus]
MMLGLGRKKLPDNLTYEESRELAQNGSDKTRADLAMRVDLRPEVLYFLAEDPSSEVRRRIAANAKTPRQAHLLLARDADEAVRAELASKVAQLTAPDGRGAQEKAQRFVEQTLEVLARDQTTRVRQILAEALKSVAHAPPQVIQRLARDAEDVVACPILEFSPLLSDADLLEIIASSGVSSRLCAISRRSNLGEALSDAIVQRNDRKAVTELLANGSAQIREETLDSLIDASVTETTWQPPLVVRPALSAGAVKKLAGFVADSLLKKLQNRSDLDHKTAEAVAEVVRKRIEEGAADMAAADDPAAEAAKLKKAGKLNGEVVGDAVLAGKRDFVRHALALMAGVEVDFIDRVLQGHSAKGVTALAWKAGCSMRVAMQLQTNMGGIPPAKALHARDGEFPLSPEEMEWQLDFFASLGQE